MTVFWQFWVLSTTKRWNVIFGDAVCGGFFNERVESKLNERRKMCMILLSVCSGVIGVWLHPTYCGLSRFDPSKSPNVASHLRWPTSELLIVQYLIYEAAVPMPVCKTVKNMIMPGWENETIVDHSRNKIIQLIYRIRISKCH